MSAARKIDISPEIEAQGAVYQEVIRLHALILVSLKAGGLELTLDDAFVPLAFAHVTKHDNDIVCMAFRGKRSYELKMGVSIPVGEHPDRPSAVDVYVSIENEIGGVRINKRTNHDTWHALFWSVDGSRADIGFIRRDILRESTDLVRDIPGGRVDEVLQRMGRLYMTGLWSARLS